MSRRARWRRYLLIRRIAWALLLACVIAEFYPVVQFAKYVSWHQGWLRWRGRPNATVSQREVEDSIHESAERARQWGLVVAPGAAVFLAAVVTLIFVPSIPGWAVAQMQSHDRKAPPRRDDREEVPPLRRP